MIPSLRRQYNGAFTESRYKAFLEDLGSAHPGSIDFRVAETPVFIPSSFLRRMEDACNYVLDLIADPKFPEWTAEAIPPAENVPGETERPNFICFDFGICTGPDGQPEPQLIELQGFASLFAFQLLMPECFRKHFPIPEDFSALLGGFDRLSYISLLQEILIGDAPPEEVILLEVKPHEQKTRVDFYCTEDIFGIRPVCLTELTTEGDKLYYRRDEVKTRVRRIYNRVIFDDLRGQEKELGPIVDLTHPWDVKWVGHPNWFYRVSKYLLPLFHHPQIPEAYFVNEIKQAPADLDHYVLKPLYSFAGQGVVIDVTERDLENVQDPQHWILQRKVPYADIIPTPDGPAKCEVRLMYVWPPGAPRALPALNLARLSKGQMIGTRYNKDRTWVGGTTCFFEPSGHS